jgi:hypothetical protein
MAAAIGVRTDHASADLHVVARRCGDGDHVRRLLAVARNLDGGSFSEAAKGLCTGRWCSFWQYGTLRQVEGALPVIDVTVPNVALLEPVAKNVEDLDAVRLILGRVATTEILVTSEGSDMLRQALLVPDTGAGSTYELPIAKPAAFGKSTFSLTLSDAGAITFLSYSKTNGTSAALDAANGVSTAFKSKTTAADVAEAKAEADFIVHQQRVVRCRATPQACT